MDDRELTDPVLDEGFPAGEPKRTEGGCLRGCLIGCAGVALLGVLVLIVLFVATDRFVRSTLLAPAPIVSDPPPLPPEQRTTLDEKIRQLASELAGPTGNATIELSAEELNGLARSFLESPEWKKSAPGVPSPSVRIDFPGPKTFDLKLSVPADSGKEEKPVGYFNVQARGELYVRDSEWRLILADARIGNFRLPAWFREGLAQRFDPRLYEKEVQIGRHGDYEIVTLDIADSGEVKVNIRSLLSGGGEEKSKTGDNPAAEETNGEAAGGGEIAPSPAEPRRSGPRALSL